MLGKYHSLIFKIKLKVITYIAKKKILVFNLYYLLIKNEITLVLDLDLAVSVSAMGFKHACPGHQSTCSIFI